MSQTPLWSKGHAPDDVMLAFTSRDDHVLDQELLPFDLLASKAHVRGLVRIGALPEEEGAKLCSALEQIERDVSEGRFTIDPTLEDGHTAIEHALVLRLGETGKRVHLGRSRNDQVLTAIRLYERAACVRIVELLLSTFDALYRKAEAAGDQPMPGYTHLQRAMPQNVGHWLYGYSEGMLASTAIVLDAFDALDSSPLGAAAGYGINLALDREGCAEELGFSRVDVNPLWSQSSRALTDVTYLSALFHPMAVTRRLAWDLSLFTTAEFAFVRLPDGFTTGSSIMPQKRNPDVIELLRAACSIVTGAMNEVMTISALPSGYHRDHQLTKSPLFRATREVIQSLSLLPRLIDGLEFQPASMETAITMDLLATDEAVRLATEGMPFREAYRRVGANPGDPKIPAGGGAIRSIEARVSLGAPGNLRPDLLRSRRAELGRRWESKRGA